MRWFCLLVVCALISSCGKNDDLRGVQYMPAPPPGSSGPYAPAPYGYPGPYGNSPYGYNPYNPNQQYPGVPPYAYPYYPMVPYLQQSGQWQRWNQYCQKQGLNPFLNFNHFWYQYCPTQCDPVAYDYYRSHFYQWMTPQYSFPYTVTPENFWYYYDGVPNYCWGGC